MYSLTIKRTRGVLSMDGRFDNSPEQNSPFGKFIEKEMDRIQYRARLFEAQEALLEEAGKPTDNKELGKERKKVVKAIEAAMESGNPLGDEKREGFKKDLAKAAEKVEKKAEEETEEEAKKKEEAAAKQKGANEKAAKEDAKKVEEARKRREAEEAAAADSDDKGDDKASEIKNDIETSGGVSTTPPDNNPETGKPAEGEVDAVQVTGGKNDPASQEKQDTGDDEGDSKSAESQQPAPSKKVAVKKKTVKVKK